jgi:hypothetical protein
MPTFGIKNSQTFNAAGSIKNYDKSQIDKTDYIKRLKVDFVCFRFKWICRSKYKNNNKSDTKPKPWL